MHGAARPLTVPILRTREVSLCLTKTLISSLRPREPVRKPAREQRALILLPQTPEPQTGAELRTSAARSTLVTTPHLPMQRVPETCVAHRIRRMRPRKTQRQRTTRRYRRGQSREAIERPEKLTTPLEQMKLEWRAKVDGAHAGLSCLHEPMRLFGVQRARRSSFLNLRIAEHAGDHCTAVFAVSATIHIVREHVVP